MRAITPLNITPEPLYLNRRAFMRTFGAGLAVAAGAPATLLGAPSEPTDLPTSFKDITHYNNFYEFSGDKQAVARMVSGFETTPWQLEVTGRVAKPALFDVKELITRFQPEERVYRLRCVEGWSMVIPWHGFPLARILEAVQPTPEARYLKFITVHRPRQMPGQKNGWYHWPYVEGLRLDEALNDLAILATGLYAKKLLAQNGAPVRLVVPWKYGFKSIKSIVRIELVKSRPTSLWMRAAPHEYGFYANVNPKVPHPRWSQASERRIGEFRRRRTLMYNGYEEQVAHLYAGMDLKATY